MFQEKYGSCVPREELPRYDSVLEKRGLEVDRNFKRNQSTKGLAPLIWGLISLVAWFFPVVGIAVCVIGFISSIKGIKYNENKIMSIFGLIFTCIGLILTMIVIISLLGYISIQELYK